jgi:hypothetical protein
MSDASFNTVVVRDSRIQDVSTKVDYMVHKGPSQNNYQQVQATSVSTSSVTFSVNVPSENIIIDRNITMTANPTIRITLPLGSVPDGVLAMRYGITEALNQFPLNQLFTNATMTINQASMSVNTQDIMSVLLRMTNDDNLSKYSCPHMPDKRFKAYSDMALTQSNPLRSFLEANEKSIPRGAHPISFSIAKTTSGAAQTVRTQASTEAQIITALTCGTSGNDSWVIDITFRTTEPLLFMSPLKYGENLNNNAGLYGVKNIDFVFNIDTSAKRVLCSATTIPFNVSLVSMGDCRLNLNYLSVQASDLLASKNVLPYVEFARYLTVNTPNTAPNAPADIVAQAVQLSQIPNRLYIVARKPMSTQNNKDSNTFLAIENISINFNNVAGILAGATAVDLYNMSVSNGSQQDIYEFLGSANVSHGLSKNTAGSILVIDPSKDLNLPDYLSNGSIGQFSFQANVRVRNTDVATFSPELVVIAEYNGLFITQSGQSMKQTGLLTKDVVMNSTMNQFGESSQYIKKQASGNLQNLNASSLRNIPLLNMKKSGSGAVSGGSGNVSGGGLSAGGMSGGYSGTRSGGTFSAGAFY